MSSLPSTDGQAGIKDVEWKIIHNFDTYTSITATKAKPFPGGKLKADILLSGITTIDNPAGRNWYLDVTSTNPMGVTNQELTLATSRAHGSTTPATTSLQSAKRAEERKHTKYDAICTATGVGLVTFRARNDSGHGASTAAVYLACLSASARFALVRTSLRGSLCSPASAGPG